MSDQSSRTCQDRGTSPSRPSLQMAPAEPSEYDIRAMPWKYIGYRGYSDFLSSEDDYLIFRRFGTLNTRVLLSLQDQLAVLEQKLADLEEMQSSASSEHYDNGTFRNDTSERREVLENITSALRQYNAAEDSLLLQQCELYKRPKAPLRDVKSIKRWHQSYDNNVLPKDETDYLEHAEDLINVAAREKTPFRRLIDRSRWLRTLPIWKEKRTNPPRAIEGTLYFSDKRLDRSASIAIVIVGAGMLLTPIWILQALNDLKMKLVVITVFISAFLVTMSWAMVAKPFEALGATAAYAAVLMVFLQIDQSDQTGGPS